MKRSEQESQLERMTAMLDFDYWLKKAQGQSYVGLNNDGEVELEEIETREEK